MDVILQINPKFEQIIPPLSEDEFSRLEENILKHGKVTDPIKTWKGIIIDGHHRYKIIQKYPEIPFTTYEMPFENEYEVIAWICDNQLGRRNLIESQKRYLIGERYRIERKIAKFHGNQHTLADESGGGRSDHHHKEKKTRERIADINGVSDAYVKRAVGFADGVDAAEEVYPGIKKLILSEEIEVTIPELTEIAKMNPEERKEAVKLLLVPKDKRKSKEIARQIEETFANGIESEPEEEELQEKEQIDPVPASVQIPEHTESDKEDSKTKEHEIEESILNSMIGAVNMFIDNINNYLSRFPRLRTDPKYRSQTREIMVAARDYINDVEGDLL